MLLAYKKEKQDEWFRMAEPSGRCLYIQNSTVALRYRLKPTREAGWNALHVEDQAKDRKLWRSINNKRISHVEQWEKSKENGYVSHAVDRSIFCHSKLLIKKFNVSYNITICVTFCVNQVKSLKNYKNFDRKPHLIDQ